MFAYLYEWLKNIAFYLVLVTVIVQIVPNQTYVKYVRFFTGIVLILLLSGPILKILGMEHQIGAWYEQQEYQQKLRELEEAARYLENITLGEEQKDGE